MELSTEAEDAAAQWPAWAEGNHAGIFRSSQTPNILFHKPVKTINLLKSDSGCLSSAAPEVSYQWWCRSASSYSWDFFMKVICHKRQSHLYSSITLRWAQTNMLSCSCMFVCSSVTSWEKCTTSYLCRDVKVELNIYSLDFISWFIIKL